MTALDTNIVVRLVLRDEPDQLVRARALLEAEPCWVSETVLLETAWVLRSQGGLSQLEIARQLRLLLDLPTVTVIDEAAVRAALGDADAGMDLADAFHRAFAGPATRLVTFDRRFADTAAARPGLPVDLL